MKPKTQWDTSKRAKELRLLYPFGDRDKDGVPNILDCQPFNPLEQGFFDWVSKGVSVVKKTFTPVVQKVTPVFEEVRTRVTAIKPVVKRYAKEISKKSTSLTGLYLREARKPKHKIRKRKPAPSTYEKVLAPSLTHFKLVSEVAGKGEKIYEKKVTRPLESFILGGREKALREQAQKVEHLYKEVKKYEKPEWKRTKEGAVILPTEPVSEVKLWEQRWKPYIRGGKFTGTEAQYQQYLQGFRKYYKETKPDRYVLREQYLRLTPEAQRYEQALKRYEEEAEKYKSMPQPSTVRQFTAGAVGTIAGMPGFVVFGMPRIATEAIVKPTAVPSKAISYGKGMIEMAKERPAYFAGSAVAMIAPVGAKGIRKIPISSMQGLETIPKGYIKYKGIAYKGKPILGCYTVKIHKGYKKGIRIQRPLKVDIRIPFKRQAIIKEFQSPIKTVRRGKITIKSPIHISGFKFGMQKPIKKVIVGERFKIGEPQRVGSIAGYRIQNILKEVKIGQVKLSAPLKIKLPKIRLQKPKISLQAPLKTQKGKIDIKTASLLRAIKKPKYETIKAGIILGGGAKVGIPIKVGKTSIKIPIKGAKERGWTPEDIKSIEEYLAMHRARGGIARAKRLEELEKKRLEMKKEPYEIVFTSGIAPSEVYTGAVPTPGIEMPKLPRPSHLPPEMMTSGIVKGKELKIIGYKYPEHEIRITSGIIGKPPGARLGLTEEQWVSGLTEAEVSRILRTSKHPEYEVRMVSGFVGKPPKVRLGLTEGQWISGLTEAEVAKIKSIMKPPQEPLMQELIARIKKPHVYSAEQTRRLLKTTEEPKIGETHYKVYKKGILTLPVDLPLQIRFKQIREPKPEVLGSTTEFLRSLKFPQIYGEVPVIAKPEKILPIRVGRISLAKGLRVKYTNGITIGEAEPIKRGLIKFTGKEPLESVRLISIEGKIRKKSPIESLRKKWAREESEYEKKVQRGELKGKEIGGQVLLEKTVKRAEQQAKRAEKVSSEILGIRRETRGRQKRGALRKEKGRELEKVRLPEVQKKRRKEVLLIPLVPRTAGIWEPSIPQVKRKRRFVSMLVPGISGLAPSEVIREKEKPTEKEKKKEGIISISTEKWLLPEPIVERGIQKGIVRPKIPEPEIPRYPTVTVTTPIARIPPVEKAKIAPFPKPPSKRVKRRRRPSRGWAGYFEIASIRMPKEIMKDTINILGGGMKK